MRVRNTTMKSEQKLLTPKEVAKWLDTELWDRYCAIKSERWSKAMEGSLVPTFKTCVLPAIGETRALAATASHLQGLLNAPGKSPRSHSATKKARTHLKVMFESAVDDKILDGSPARHISMPKRIGKVDDTFAGRTTVHALFDATDRRDHIILRLFVTCGLRPQETFPLRASDIERGRLRVDEALKQASWHAAADLGSYRPPGVHTQKSAQRLAVEFGNPAAGSSAGTITGNATPYLVHSR
jgi:integrase